MLTLLSFLLLENVTESEFIQIGRIMCSKEIKIGLLIWVFFFFLESSWEIFTFI